MSVDDHAPALDPVAQRRSTRGRPAKPPLSEESIVDATLAILQAEGLDAVSMRRVGRALDTGAASLYVYFANREALLQALLDRVTASVVLEPPDPERWRTQLHSLLLRIYQALLAHPGVAALTLGDGPTTEPMLLVTENLLGILHAGRVDPQDAAWACDIFTMLITAAAAEEEVRRSASNGYASREARVDELHAAFDALPVDRFPLLSTYKTEMLAGDAEARIRFGIDLVVDGVVARAARGR